MRAAVCQTSRGFVDSPPGMGTRKDWEDCCNQELEIFGEAEL